MTEFATQKAILKAQLREDSLSSIHISFDLWTSSNSLALMAVVAHYTDYDYKVKTRFLALRRLHGHYGGENQAELLIEIIKDFDIVDRLGYFVTDNAFNNDTAIEIVLPTLLPTLNVSQRQQRRLRCWGHILNLAAKAFLFGKNADDFDEEILIHHTLAQEKAELEKWRKCGPIGKLHNCVVFVRRSPQRRETFLDLAEAGDAAANLILLQNNATRWNSTYIMIDRAIAKKDSLDAFIANSIYETEKYKIVPIEDRLTTEDWRVLVETHSILKPFNTHTKRLQSRASDGIYGAIWEAYPSIEYLLRHILTKKREYAEKYEALDPTEDDAAVSESRRHIKDNCWGKLDQYYKILDTLLVYMASLVLHSGQKLSFVDHHWVGRRTWIERAKKT